MFGWALLIIIGTPLLLIMFGSYVTNQTFAELDALEKTDFKPYTFQSLPWFVRLLLGKWRARSLAIGFEELITFSRTGMKELNFACILVAPDRRTIIELEYVRVSPLTSFFLLFRRPIYFFRFLIGIHGICLATVFPQLKRVITTPAAFLSEQSVPGQKEIHVISRKLPLETAYLQHQQTAREFAAKYALTPLSFGSAEDFLDFERASLKRTVQKERRELEAAQNQDDAN